MDQVATRRNVIALAVVVGLIAAALAWITPSRQGKPRPPTGNLSVMYAKRDIPVQTVIEQGILETKPVAPKDAPTDPLTSEDVAAGQVATTDIAAGQPVLRGQVMSKSSAAPLAFHVPERMRAVTVALDPIIGVAGFLKPGNYVDVVATFNINDGTVTKTVLQNVQLLATGDQAMQSSLDKSGKPAEAPNATLCVDPRDAEKLILAESKGKLRLTLRGVGDNLRVMTSGITSRALVGFVPPDAGKQAASMAMAPAPRPMYYPPRTGVMSPFYNTMGSPSPLPIIAPRREIEVIKGTQVERVPVKT